jgi:hypothetical protein
MQQRLRGLELATFAVAAAMLAACGGGGSSVGSPPPPPPPPPPAIVGAFQLSTPNNRADLVSDDDVMIAISASAGGNFNGLSVDVDGRNVTGAFALSGSQMVGLVTGLVSGNNVITARGTNMTGARITVTNAPRSGPVLSGAQINPYYCAQPTPRAYVNGSATPAVVASGLAGAPDATCNISTEFKLYYRTTAACSLTLPDPVWTISPTATTVPAQPTAAANVCFKPYTAGAARPADMAQTTTDAGRTVDYIVRVERGVINRGIYDIVALFDPATGWTAAAPQPQWNGKVFFSFGASTGQPRRQVRPANIWPAQEDPLRRGYIIAMNSMTDSSRNSNRVMMSETVMMMKEHIADTYGSIRFAIGTGCSGGSINSNTTASIMPGLLDGLITACTYPDSESTALEVADCVVLVEAYQKPAMVSVWSNLGLSQAQINARKAAINGHVDPTACHAWYNSFGSNGQPGVYFQRGVLDNNTGAVVQSATATNNCELPNLAVYDPANRATTSTLPRCDGWSWGESLWGKPAGAVEPRNPRDNVGVQYGLKALNDGVITPEEFVTLNEIVGGSDSDSQFSPARTIADSQALVTAYRSGMVMSGRNLARVPIIDTRGWDDSLLAANTPPGLSSPGGIHHIWYSFALRDRLVADSDSHNAGNQAMWRYTRPSLGPSAAMSLEALSTMDTWLTAVKADTSSATLEQKVRTTRPASSVDFCYLSNDAAQTNRVTNFATCDADVFLKPSLSPRQVAGGPRAENILKCQLKPLVASDYPTLSGAQVARLQAVFPGGVCDWSKPGVGQQPAASPLTFKAGPGGADLPAAPVSVAVP